MCFWILIVSLSSIFFATSTCIASSFPYRVKYPDVNTIELSDLKSGYDSGDFIIIDLPSPAEFEVIHIKNAVNIPYGHVNFTRDLNRIAKANPNDKMADFDNGIVTWALAYPSDTLLFENKMKAPGNQLISEEQFNTRNLDFNRFMKMTKRPDAVIFDLRDPVQRNKKLPDLETAYRISMEKLIKNIISKQRMKDKQLFIFDQVGRKVKWVLYYLTNNNYSEFYFLDGGATAVLKEQKYRVVLKH